MPRVPAYQPGQVGPVEITNARFRAADNNGGALGGLGRGLAGLGDATQRYAVVQDQINAQNDDTQARKMAVEAASRIGKLTTEYSSLMGSNARERQAEIAKQLDEIRDEYLGQASNGRMRSLLEQRLIPLHGDGLDKVTSHALKEAKVERTTALKGEQVMYGELAANETDPVKRMEAITAGVRSVEAFLDFNGVADPATRTYEVKRYTSGVHRDIIDAELAKPNADIDMAAAYFDAHRDEMLGDDRLKVMAVLKKPLEDRSDEMLFGEIVAGIKPVEGTGSLVGPGNPRADFMAKVRGVESSGDDNARNPRSSATGRYQFTDGTWLATYKARFGNDGLSDQQILAKRTDGAVQEVLMRELTDQNEKSLRAANLPVTAGTLYLAHFAGEAGAKQLLTANPNASAASVLGEKVVNANPHLRGMKAKDVIAWADRKMGSTGGSSETPSAWDKDQIYAAIDREADARGLTLEQRDRLKARADREITTRENLLQRQQNEASDAAFKSIVELGDNFTSIAQIPRQVRDQMSAQDLARYSEQADKNKEAKSKPPEKGGDWLTLQMMMRAEPERFKSVDMRQYLGKLPASELNDLVLKQVDMRSKPSDGPNYREGINKAITWGKKYGGVEVDDKDFPEVFDTMQGILKEKSAKGPLSDADYDAAFKSAVTAKVKTSGGGLFGMGSGTRAPYEITYDMLPDRIKGQAWNALRRQGVQTPTKGQVLEVARTIMAGN